MHMNHLSMSAWMYESIVQCHSTLNVRTYMYTLFLGAMHVVSCTLGQRCILYTWSTLAQTLLASSSKEGTVLTSDFFFYKLHFMYWKAWELSISFTALHTEFFSGGLMDIHVLVVRS